MTATRTKGRRQAEPGQPRTLIFSQRNLTRIQPFRCAHFEFEDVVGEVEGADFLKPVVNPDTRRHWFAKKMAYHTPLKFNPGVQRIPVEKNYDLFFAVCGDPTDLLRISFVPDWRAKCAKAVCLLDEVWVREVGRLRNYLRMLRQFDLVVLYYSKSVSAVDEMIGENKCIFLPPGVDMLRFCPYPKPPNREIDVYSIGRRSALTHKSFLRMADHAGMFYLHDSTSADRVLDPIEHRILFANIAKRSRYFIVNPGLIDRPDVRGDQIEIGNRYFEGAAAGNILLGERPRNGEFEKFFDWPDALIDLPYNSPDAEAIVLELDQQPQRQAKIQKMNVYQSLMRHDWVYRWEAILKAVGLSPLPHLEARKEQLNRLARQVLETEVADSSTRSFMASAYQMPITR